MVAFSVLRALLWHLADVNYILSYLTYMNVTIYMIIIACEWHIQAVSLTDLRFHRQDTRNLGVYIRENKHMKSIVSTNRAHKGWASVFIVMLCYVHCTRNHIFYAEWWGKALMLYMTWCMYTCKSCYLYHRMCNTMFLYPPNPTRKVSCCILVNHKTYGLVVMIC